MQKNVLINFAVTTVNICIKTASKQSILESFVSSKRLIPNFNCGIIQMQKVFSILKALLAGFQCITTGSLGIQLSLKKC